MLFREFSVVIYKPEFSHVLVAPTERKMRHQVVVVDEPVRWNRQIQRRGNTLEHAPREVELGAVAGTEKAARPVGAHFSLVVG